MCDSPSSGAPALVPPLGFAAATKATASAKAAGQDLGTGTGHGANAFPASSSSSSRSRSSSRSSSNPFSKPLLLGPRAGVLVNLKSASYTLQGLHSDDNAFLAPSFPKVTRTPWGGSAKVLGGYGRRVFMTSVSKDAPRFFQIQEVVEHKRQRYPPREKRGVVEQRGGAISGKAPALFSTAFRSSVERGDVRLHTKGVKLLTDKQTLFEPIKTRRAVTAVDWGGL